MIVARGGSDDITSFEGDDDICGNGGRDFIEAGSGDDTVDLGPGGNNQEARGGSGDDYLQAGFGVASRVSISGGSGDDTIFDSQATGDGLFGGSGADDLSSHGSDNCQPGGDPGDSCNVD